MFDASKLPAWANVPPTYRASPLPSSCAYSALTSPGLFVGFKSLQKAYAVIGAGFLPLQALVLLLLCGRSDWIGARMRNRPLTVLVLILTIAFLLTAGALDVHARLSG